ncbi:MAG TPA: CAP domain-containing protein [Candidatus Acidoferrum sp.]|nr:CAP domain-containing protein [Candidatus Acidoferrum sp.]
MPGRKVLGEEKASAGVAIAVVGIVVIIALMAGLVYLYTQTGIITTTTFSTTVVQLGSQNYTSTVQQSQINQSYYDIYVLSLINKDRNQYGLPNVTLSTEPSAQQHANNMLQNYYLSHWDVFGMKPYMRYTLLGGTQAVSENIAFNGSEICELSLCTGDVNVKSALASMEYDMMYNDYNCCDNGHRDNILDPYHNQVSIGVAYNSGIAYLVEDFIGNYTTWTGGSPQFSNNVATLSGSLTSGYSISSVEVSYDAPLINMTQAQLNATGSYGYGPAIAGVVSNPLYYYNNITTIVANKYSTNGNDFDISFNMQKLIQQYGPGEYTLLIWLNNTSGGSFIGSTYTIFINSNDEAYTPSGV